MLQPFFRYNQLVIVLAWTALHYQSILSMYIRGLIPQNWPMQFRLTSPLGTMSLSKICDSGISWS